MLHMLMTSPYRCDFALLLSMLHKGDDLLLLQDGVLAALSDSRSLAALRRSLATLYVLQEDIEARGIVDRIFPGITVINYAGFVDLTVKQTKQLAWR